MPTPEVIKNLYRAINPDGKIIGFVRAPLYLPSEKLRGFRVFPPEEVKEGKCWWVEDLGSITYDMTSGITGHGPMATFEVRRTHGEQYFRPNTLLSALRRSILISS